MGMFDYYIPVPDVNCPNCDLPLAGWQGKDADCGLFVWQQGSLYPIENKGFASDNRTLNKRRLPMNFIIYTWCENCADNWIEAECKSENEVWTKIINISFEIK